jgi:hypothetical protein
MITLAIIALGFAIFRFAVKHLPIFAAEKATVSRALSAPLPASGD